MLADYDLLVIVGHNLVAFLVQSFNVVLSSSRVNFEMEKFCVVFLSYVRYAGGLPFLHTLNHCQAKLSRPKNRLN